MLIYINSHIIVNPNGLNYKQMEISAKNVLSVLAVIAAVVLVLILVYFTPIIGGVIIGVTVTEVTDPTTGLNLSAAMTTFIDDTETGYITSSTSALQKVGIAIAIFAVVIILILFGMTDIFERLKDMIGSGRSGGSKGGVL